MYYFSRNSLIKSILNEAIAMDDSDEFNKPRRRTLKGTGNVFTDLYRKPAFQQYSANNSSENSIKHSKGGQLKASFPPDKLIITPPDVNVCKYVFGISNPYNIDPANAPSDHQGAQTVIYWKVLFDFGLVFAPPTASKKFVIKSGNKKEIKSAIKRVDKMIGLKKWSPDMSLANVMNEIYRNPTLETIFLRDPLIKNHTSAAFKSHDVNNLQEFHDFIIKGLNDSIIEDDMRHTLTTLENKAARSISAVDMRMKKAGYADGIMNVNDMFDYLKKTNPYRYSTIMQTYDLSPEFIKEHIHNYDDLCKWIYREDRLPILWASAGIRTRAKKTGDFRRAIPAAVQARDEDLKYMNAKKYSDGTIGVSKRGKSLEYYEQELETAKENLEKAKLNLLQIQSRGVSEDDPEYIEAYSDFKKKYSKVNNTKAAIKKFKAKIENTDGGFESDFDKMQKHRGKYRDTLTAFRDKLDYSHLAAFDMEYDYPKLMRELNPAIPDDLLSDMYEFSFTLMEENGKSIDTRIASFIDKWASKHFNKIEKEHGYEGCLNFTVVEMDVELDKDAYEYTRMLRIIFDYPENSYMNTLLTGDDVEYAAQHIIFQICDEVEVETDEVLKIYYGEGHGVALHEPSSAFLK